MKAYFLKMFFFFIPLLLFAGEKTNLLDSYELKKAIDSAVIKLEERENLDGSLISYIPGKERPFTGWRKQIRDNDELRSLEQFKNGQSDGLYLYFAKQTRFQHEKSVLADDFTKSRMFTLANPRRSSSFGSLSRTRITIASHDASTSVGNVSFQTGFKSSSTTDVCPNMVTVLSNLLMYNSQNCFFFFRERVLGRRDIYIQKNKNLRTGSDAFVA